MNAARPADRRMLFHIGINLGDVIADGEDIYGDEVGIARAAAEPRLPPAVSSSRMLSTSRSAARWPSASISSGR